MPTQPANMLPGYSSSHWSTVAEFNALKALGPKAVPLVLWRLVLDQEDTTAVYLCMPCPEVQQFDTARFINASYRQPPGARSRIHCG